MYLHFAKQIAQAGSLSSFSSSLSDSPRLCQRSASLSLASCVPASIYTPVCGLPRPRSVVYDLSRITLTVESKQDTPSEALVQNDALDASAVLTGRSVCVCVFYRKCTWGRRPSARWTGCTSTARTSPE